MLPELGAACGGVAKCVYRTFLRRVARSTRRSLTTDAAPNPSVFSSSLFAAKARTQRRHEAGRVLAAPKRLPPPPPQSADAARAAFKFVRGFTFDPDSFGAGLAELVEVLKDADVDKMSVQQKDLGLLSNYCEEWTSERLRSARRPADMQLMLRAHTLLRLPLTATLRANTRRWLHANCHGLEPQQLFPLLCWLPTVALLDDDQADSSNPEQDRSTSRADLDLLDRVACRAHGYFPKATLIELTGFLCAFVQLDVDPTQFNPHILDDLFGRLEGFCRQLTLDDSVAIIEAMNRVGLTPEKEFWLVAMQRFGEGQSDKVHSFWTLMWNRQKVADRLTRFESAVESVLMPATDCLSSEKSKSENYTFAEVAKSGLARMELIVLFSAIKHLSAKPPGFLLKHLTDNTALWPVLLKRMQQDIGQFKGDPQLLQSLIQTLLWLPNGMCAQAEGLIQAIFRDLKDEAFQLRTVLQPPTAKSSFVCHLIRKLLRLLKASFLDNIKASLISEEVLWHPQTAATQPIDVILCKLAHIPVMISRNLISPPNAQWWAVFRERMSERSACRPREMWATLHTVNRLLSSPSKAQPKCNRHLFLLPADWYRTILRLAASLNPLDAHYSRSIRQLFWILRNQRIQFDEEQRLLLSDISERFCASTESAGQFMPTLACALELQLPVSAQVWQRVARVQPSRKVTFVQELLVAAASHWALRLPGAPSPDALRRLVQLAAIDKASGKQSWCQQLRLLIGDEFLPKDCRSRSQLQKKSRFLKNDLFSEGADEALAARLKAEYGHSRVHTNVPLPDAAGITVDYMVAKSDGTKTAFICDAAKLHYWLMPEDVQGGFTLAMSTKIHLLEQARYEFQLA